MTTELENQPVTVESLAENLLHFELRGLQPDAWLADIDSGKITMTNGRAAVLLHDVEKLKNGALPNCAA